MDTYPLDIDPKQIVRWLIEEQRSGRLHLDVLATRSYITEPLGEAEMQRLGDEEDEDLSDVLAVGILDVSPAAESDGWVLRMRVEDRIGPRLPEDGDAPDGEEEIDLETFETEFILPERGTIDVSPDAKDSVAKGRVTRLFGHMLRNEHSAARRG